MGDRDALFGELRSITNELSADNAHAAIWCVLHNHEWVDYPRRAMEERGLGDAYDWALAAYPHALALVRGAHPEDDPARLTRRWLAALVWRMLHPPEASSSHVCIGLGGEQNLAFQFELDHDATSLPLYHVTITPGQLAPGTLNDHAALSDWPGLPDVST